MLRRMARYSPLPQGAASEDYAPLVFLSWFPWIRVICSLLILVAAFAAAFAVMRLHDEHCKLTVAERNRCGVAEIIEHPADIAP